MTATIHQIRPHKPNRRPTTLPPALRHSTPAIDARWLAALREDTARRVSRP